MTATDFTALFGHAYFAVFVLFSDFNFIDWFSSLPVSNYIENQILSLMDKTEI